MVEGDKGGGPVEGFGNAGDFVEVGAAEFLDEGGDLAESWAEASGILARTISSSFSKVG